MSSIIYRTIVATTFLAASTVAQTDIENILGNWDILFQSLETDFQGSIDSEITLGYLIGTGRTFNIDLFDKACNGPITGMNITHTGLAGTHDEDHDRFEVKIDLDKTKITY